MCRALSLRLLSFYSVQHFILFIPCIVSVIVQHGIKIFSRKVTLINVRNLAHSRIFGIMHLSFRAHISFLLYMFSKCMLLHTNFCERRLHQRVLLLVFIMTTYRSIRLVDEHCVYCIRSESKLRDMCVLCDP